jgi:hypothetical protein
MLKIAIGLNFALQIADGRLDARMIPAPLESQEHEGGRTGDWLGEPAENVAIAIVNSAIVVGPIQQQAKPFFHSGIGTVAGPTQRQASPSCRLDPSKIIFRPGPTHDANVDVVHLGGAGVLRHSSTVGKHRFGSSLHDLGRFPKKSLDIQNQGSRPECLLSAMGQPARPIRR